MAKKVTVRVKVNHIDCCWLVYPQLCLRKAYLHGPALHLLINSVCVNCGEESVFLSVEQAASLCSFSRGFETVAAMFRVQD